MKKKLPKLSLPLSLSFYTLTAWLEGLHSGQVSVRLMCSQGLSYHSLLLWVTLIHWCTVNINMLHVCVYSCVWACVFLMETRRRKSKRERGPKRQSVCISALSAREQASVIVCKYSITADTCQPSALYTQSLWLGHCWTPPLHAIPPPPPPPPIPSQMGFSSRDNYVYCAPCSTRSHSRTHTHIHIHWFVLINTPTHVSAQPNWVKDGCQQPICSCPALSRSQHTGANMRGAKISTESERPTDRGEQTTNKWKDIHFNPVMLIVMSREDSFSSTSLLSFGHTATRLQVYAHGGGFICMI